MIEAGNFTIEVVKLLEGLKTAGFFICVFTDKDKDPAPPILKQEEDVNEFVLAYKDAKTKNNRTEYFKIHIRTINIYMRLIGSK